MLNFGFAVSFRDKLAAFSKALEEPFLKMVHNDELYVMSLQHTLLSHLRIKVT